MLEDGSAVDAKDGDGVEDAVLERLKIEDNMYKKAVEEVKARPELKIVTEVQGISRQE